MVKYVNPMILNDGVMDKVREHMNIGSAKFSKKSLNIRNNNSEINAFTEVYADTRMASLNFKLNDKTNVDGNVIKIIDKKNTFLKNPIKLEGGKNAIDGYPKQKSFPYNGSVIELYYLDEYNGWISFVKGINRNDLKFTVLYDIPVSSIGDRSGLLVYQTKSPNVVDLACASDKSTLPVVGVIINDQGTKAIVQTRNIDEAEIQLDYKAKDPKPSQKVFLSEVQHGYGTNIKPEKGYIQQIGTIRKVISKKFVKINYIVYPEHVESLCQIPGKFGASTFVDVAMGDGFQLFLDETGHVWATGVNSYGQLGVDSLKNQEDPIRIDYPCPVYKVACGDYHSLMIDVYHNIWSMGRNNYGQLGKSTQYSISAVPVKLEVQNNDIL